MSNKVAIQGLPGSYTEQALMEIEPLVDKSDVLYLETFDDVFNAVNVGDAGRAVVAFSNTRINFIQRPSELLLSHEAMGNYWIDGGVTIPVHHCLVSKSGAKIELIDTVVSQAEALRQCGDTLRSLNGRLTTIERKDTALGAKEVAESDSDRTAAICSTWAAELYGLEILRADIQDDDINLTRFVRFTKADEGRIREPNPDNSIAVLTLQQRIGSLDDALSTFTRNGVDMRTLRSRNIPNTDMEVDMIVEIRRGIDDSLRNVIEDLAKIGASVTFVGTYTDKSNYKAKTSLTTKFRELSAAEEVKRFEELLARLTGEK